MAKPSQILQIEPPVEISFKGPFTDVVTSQIKLTNPSEKPFCFKVKTTAPKQYCVRPNSGLIPAHGTISVSVMLQPFDNNLEETNKHKFMVQTTYVPEGDQSLDNIWKNVPASEIMDSKLRVKFDTPELNIIEKSVQKSSLSQAKTGSNTEAEIRRTVDDSKRLSSQLQQFEQENSQLRERVKQLESRPFSASSSIGAADSSMAGMTSSMSFTMIHLGLAAVLALIVGLILGKIF